MILLTGGSGFLGRSLLKVIERSSIVTLSRTNSDINCDLANDIPVLSDFDIIIHAAGKAHSIPKSPEEVQTFFDINVTGTNNLLQGLENGLRLPKSFVYISSVSVYGLEEGLNITENEPLMANDPYGKSKIKAEKIIQEWCERFDVKCSILRLPLLAGKNPPGNLGSMIKGIKKGYYFNIGRGKARKSMVLVDDVNKFILNFAKVGGIYNLTDGYHPSFYELSKSISDQVRKSIPMNIPIWIGKIIAYTGDLIGNRFPINSNKLKKMTSDLTFDDSEARRVAGWKPRSVIQEFKI